MPLFKRFYYLTINMYNYSCFISCFLLVFYYKIIVTKKTLIH